MKNYNLPFITLILFTLLQQSYVFAQKTTVKDSVTIYIDNQIEMLFEIDDFDLLRDSAAILKSLKSFEENLIHITTLEGELKPEDSDLLTMMNNDELTSEIQEPKITYLRDGDLIKNTGIRDKAIIHSTNCLITVTVSDFRKTLNPNFQTAFLKLLPQLPKKSRSSHTIFYQYENYEMTSLKSKNRIDEGNDLIELGVGAGASLIKNQWVGDFGIKLGFTLMNRDKTWHKFYTSANFLYDFSNQNKTNINTFLNLGYEVDFYGDKEQTLGFEFGYLISKRGNTFDKNTMRLGLSWSPSSSITVSPQIYFPGKLKGAYPGVRIGFGF